ncbi:MAG: amidophosphoribosyltransferase, partial [Polyangiaceae bacterium]
ARYVTADSLAYLSLDGMLEAVAGKGASAAAKNGFCHACFSGKYAINFVPSGKRHIRLVGV